MQPGKHVGLLGGKSLYADAATSLPSLRASDFTSITFGKLSISRDGALSLDDAPLFAGGRYVGEPVWPELVASLRASATSLRRLEVLVGPVDGANVSELARNFRALKSTLPDVVAVALDDDSVRDVDATVPFALLLGSLGFKLSLVPSTRSPELWGELYERLSTTPELIERLLLDLEPSGVENDVANWSKWFSALPIEPGWSGRHGDDCSLGNAPEVITSKAFFMRDEVAGAWVRLLDDVPSCSTQYAPTSYARAIEDAWTFQP
jgi:hypothetical protein